MKAFPNSEPIYQNNVIGVKQSTGMDLRDYFAAKAFQSLISNALPDCVYYTINNQSRIEIGVEILAKDAYLFADAMMEARTE
jgi:hypothetical protein